VKNSYFNSANLVLDRTPQYRTERPESGTGGGEALDGAASFLPPQENVAELLGVAVPASLAAILNAALFKPLAEMNSRSGKNVRAKLVTLCHRLVDSAPFHASNAAKQCQAAAEVVELIHLGSLVVDDIEDGSQVRRGRPALHIQYGLPVALNAGNWLYFWPAELLRRMELPETKLAILYEHYHRTLLRAHFGQAADLGCRVDHLAQSAVAPICLSTMGLKTGALMGFAATLAGMIAAAPPPVVSVLNEFGKDLGVALQMFDDLGNVIGRCEPSKRFEDLLMKRLSWVWACAAKTRSTGDYQRFVAAVDRLPDERFLASWMAQSGLIAYVRKSARDYLDRAFRELEIGLEKECVNWSGSALDGLRQLGDEIAVAYE
jgi:geranylgeranyl pyrophosphate synthase